MVFKEVVVNCATSTKITFLNAHRGPVLIGSKEEKVLI